MALGLLPFKIASCRWKVVIIPDFLVKKSWIKRVKSLFYSHQRGTESWNDTLSPGLCFSLQSRKLAKTILGIRAVSGNLSGLSLTAERQWGGVWINLSFIRKTKCYAKMTFKKKKSPYSVYPFSMSVSVFYSNVDSEINSIAGRPPECFQAVLWLLSQKTSQNINSTFHWIRQFFACVLLLMLINELVM